MMNRKFFKSLVVLFLSATGCLEASAQSGLVLETNDGKTYSYVLAEQPRITFNETDLIITAADANASFSRAEIKNFRFEDIALDIKDVTNGKSQKMTYLNGIVTVEASSNVALYDISGKLLMNKKANNGENVTINLNNQPNGTYIVRSGKQSLKVKK